MPRPDATETMLSEPGSTSDKASSAPRAALRLAAIDASAIELGRYEAHLDEIGAATAQRAMPQSLNVKLN